MKKFIFLFVAFISGTSLFGQGQSPNNIKWMEINTDHAQIIFPEEISFQAQKAANLIDVLYEVNTKTLNAKPKKVPVILYNQYTVSNGFAALRPRRSVWFSTPTQYATDLGTVDWFYTLGVHEYRHIVQQSKNNKYFTKFLSVIFGETGQLMGRYSLPYWFFEGDAVCTETALSGGGRGRIPQFEMPIRTMLLNDIEITYDQAKFGSYKKFIPGFYNLGYALTSQARVSFGEDVWDKTLTHTSKISFWPWAFSRGLKKTTGFNEKNLYSEMMSELENKWSSEISENKYTDINIINKTKKDSWTKYTEANYIDENTFIAKKISLKGDITSFYKVKRNGEEELIKTTDADLISAANNKLCWARKIQDPRWQVRSYSDIVVLDLKTKKSKRITKKQKYFAPSFSPDGKKIAVVEYNTKMESSLVIIDSETGKALQTFNEFGKEYIRTPSWNPEGTEIVFTLTNETGTAICSINIENGKIQNLTGYSTENTGRPVFWNNYILFNSPYNGTGNIYAIDIKTKERFQVTSVKYGAYNPKIMNNRMLFINYSTEGYDIAEIDLDENRWVPVEDIKEYSFSTAELLQKQEQEKVLLHPDNIPEKQHDIQKYRKLRHALNIHSWGITTEYPSSYSLDELTDYRPEVGFNIYSANMLNTVYGALNVSYNINEETFSSDISAIFKKYYPEITVSGGWYERKRTTTSGPDEWNEYRTGLKLNVPLNFSRGVYYRGANIGSQYTYTKIDNIERNVRYISEFSEGEHHSISYTGNIYNYRHTANQDINPKYGQYLYVTYKHIPFDQEYKGYQFSALTSLYFPSLFKHHSIILRGGYEKQRDTYDRSLYIFGSPQSFARGYIYPYFDELYGFRVNYSFPIWYPDLNIGPFVYFKRVRGNLYYDHFIINEISLDNNILSRSAGIELFIEAYFLRLSEPVEIGCRMSYLFDPSEGSDIYVPEFLVLGIPF